jgi:hypothetical protein
MRIFFFIASRQDPNNRMACSLLQLWEMTFPVPGTHGVTVHNKYAETKKWTEKLMEQWLFEERGGLTLLLQTC